jgi:UDP-2-acetamido-2,6-beta-L-arabino-hexul-4-ose reductase
MSNKEVLRIGITGQAGFVGTHLYNECGLLPGLFERIPFEDRFFDSPELLACFVRQCDVIVHLAAVNRHQSPDELYGINIGLVQKLISVLKKENMTPHILFSSSIQESQDNPYGKSKREGRRLLEDWAKESNASFTGLVIPNVYGPFCLPNYNSFVATFCHKLVHDEKPVIVTDSEVNLIYVSTLCKYIISDIEQVRKTDSSIIQEKHIPPDFTKKVSEVLRLFIQFKEQYFTQSIIPVLSNINDVNLFNTFRSYIDADRYFPFRLKQNTDERGTFVEVIKLGTGGQVSFSTTKAGVTRGNHFHTRKIERFTVIKGQARIQIRKIGTDKLHEFFLDGLEPAHVDMPVWYTHNITNIGTDDLYTQFWINEWYDEADPDTYFEQV